MPIKKKVNAKALVPHGDYCYTYTGVTKKGEVTLSDGSKVEVGVRETKTCPFWKRRGDWHSDMNGYCRLMKAGDNSKRGIATMLLFDKVKECDINHES